MVVEKFQNYSVKIIAIHLWVKKLNLFIFNYASKQKSPPRFYHYPPGRLELPIHPKQRFLKIFFPEEEGGRGLWSCNLYIFGLYFVMQWFSFKHAEMWRFFNLTNRTLLKSMMCRNNYMKCTTLPYPIFLTNLPTICQIKYFPLHFFLILKCSIPLFLLNK